MASIRNLKEIEGVKITDSTSNYVRQFLSDMTASDLIDELKRLKLQPIHSLKSFELDTETIARSKKQTLQLQLASYLKLLDEKKKWDDDRKKWDDDRKKWDDDKKKLEDDKKKLEEWLKTNKPHVLHQYQLEDGQFQEQGGFSGGNK